jgi:hypothetical protein
LANINTKIDFYNKNYKRTVLAIFKRFCVCAFCIT